MKSVKPGSLALCVNNNHCMMPDAFFWTYIRMLKPAGAFTIKGDSSVKAASITSAIYQAMNLGAEWMFLMDVDQTFQGNTIPKLLETAEKHNAKIVSVLYHLGRAPFGPIAGWVKKVGEKEIFVNSMGVPWKMGYAPLGNGVVEVDWVGAGGLLVHRSVIESLNWPPFFDIWEQGTGVRIMGHDVNFCLRAKEKGFKSFVDTNVISAHGKLTYFDELWAEGFTKSGMLGKMDGVLRRQVLESGYWDMIWQTEFLKNQVRDKGYPETIADIVSEVPPCALVADVGCGAAAIMEHIQSEKKATCVGYDFSEKAIEIVTQKGFEGHVADIRNFSPNGDAGRFDVVISAHVIEHMEEEEKFVSLVKALAKPGGKIVIATPWREEIQGHFEHVRGYTQEDLESLMQKHFGQVNVRKNNRDFIATGVAS